MKKKIAILGSTGSIGKNLFNIIYTDKKNFDVVLLSAKSNYNLLFRQAQLLNVKNLIITDKKSYFKLLKKVKDKNIKVFNNFDDFDLIFKKKIDYSMISITGIAGLKPTLNLIKFTKKIAIANKEAIICGWDLIKKLLNFYNVKFIPVDSEHFSIWFSNPNLNPSFVDKIYITASGGPFLNYSKKKLKKVKIFDTLKHPNWSMGRKISVDSATLMNKVFELIEAKNIFNLNYNKLSILVHKQSYIHSIIKMKNGMVKFIAHDTTMKIPIFNSLYSNEIKYLPSKVIRADFLNNLSFQKIDYKIFPIDQIIKLLPRKTSLFETVLIAANDKFVELYLKKKISFINFHSQLINFLNLNKFKIYKKKKVKKIKDILILDEYVRLKIDNMYI